MSSGILDVLSENLNGVRREVAPGTNLAAFVENGLAFLESVTCFVSMRFVVCLFWYITQHISTRIAGVDLDVLHLRGFRNEPLV